MFDQIDAAYYLQKAEFARDRAASAPDPKIAEALLRRAGFYEEQARRHGAQLKAA
ncbi:hypothetical protein LWE61_16720 [Sphingobium sufflavum]|uniref:hypothetical protein n=1 Tax=Sphingobium sufflavum TaxID=1129547 RepID=UPI001F35A88F|nr:hypothetical protein [Sphingobium sufflavum]MCE7798185.1 hypothetical protein [Sphingobium sufflavum]